MKRIILGTAGHIDHGKTSLIKALTGVDCDRLKEEKERGITIELGFTALTLSGGQQAGIVDVPGHEKFVKNMVAGVGGIDAVLLIIAADEGVMPQTREHLDICKILSIKQGIVVLTKTDMVDEELLELAVEDVREFVQGSFLEDAPMVPVSSTTGAGIDSLKAELEKLIDGSSERPAAGLFRLPIDRVFSMKGFGTVITGTLMAGSVAEGDEVDILPKKIRAKIRGVQVHGQGAQQAEAGQRTALNFQGLDKVEIQRGDVVCRAEMLMPTATVLAWFEYLAGAAKPLKNRARIRFHAGTSELIGRAVLLDAD
ncbi:MAG: selenocysteine-specific translation elongation factor, partial [Deltaproteobacteria bacterium]|nr:selenocysteine-specific translation elongation factor [Deltaproteobacteria bacterium]